MPQTKNSNKKLNSTNKKIINAIMATGVQVHPKILKALAGLKLGSDKEYPSDLWDQGGAEWDPPMYKAPDHQPAPAQVMKQEVTLKELIDDVRSSIINGNMHISYNGHNLNLSRLCQRIQQELGSVRSARAAAVAEGRNPKEELYKVVLKAEDGTDHLAANKYESIAIFEDMQTFSRLVSDMAIGYQHKIQELPKFSKRPAFMHENSYPLVKYSQWLRSTMRAFYTILRAHLKHNHKHGDEGNQSRPAATSEQKELLRKMLEIVSRMKTIKAELNAKKRPQTVYGPILPPTHPHHQRKRQRTSRKLRSNLNASMSSRGRATQSEFPSNPYLHMR